MAKLPQTSETYDRLFAGGGWGGVYALPYRHSMYYPLFREVAREGGCYGAHSLLEVGCGTGGFAQLVVDTMSVQYQGFDFSPVAVEKTATRTGRPELFSVADATDPATYRDPIASSAPRSSSTSWTT